MIYGRAVKVVRNEIGHRWSIAFWPNPALFLQTFLAQICKTTWVVMQMKQPVFWSVDMRNLLLRSALFIIFPSSALHRSRRFSASMNQLVRFYVRRRPNLETAPDQWWIGVA